MTSRSKIVQVAKSYIGVCGGSSAHADILHWFNTVKPDGYTAKKSDAWCAEFVSACAIQAFGKKTAVKYFPLSCACTVIIRKAKDKNIWVESDKYIPDAGDWILYDWQDSGKGDNKGGPDHVGLVEYYKAGYIHVIEGNYGNKVKRRKLRIDGKYIRGFVTPDYDKIKVSSPKNSAEQVIKDVLSNKYGTGKTRKEKLTAAGYNYDQIQQEVTRICKLTDEVLDDTYGTGSTRKEKLGADYDIVQWNVNRVLKEREADK